MGQGHADGTTLVELMLVAGVVAVLVGMTMPLLRTGHESTQVKAAARYIAGQVLLARSLAVRSGAAVGLRFDQRPGGYEVRSYADGDGDGLASSDISDGIDRPVGAAWRLREVYPSVRFELDGAVPPVGSGGTSGIHGDPIRFGASDIVTFNPLGTASSGTLYLKGERSGDQYAVRILGVTGRVRVLRFDRVRHRWVQR